MNTPSSPLNGNWQGNSSLDAWSEPPPNVESESESQKQPEFKELLRIQVVESSKLGGSYLTKHRIYFVKVSGKF